MAFLRVSACGARPRPAAPPFVIAGRGAHHAPVDALLRLLCAWLRGDPLPPETSAGAVTAALGHRLAGTLYHIGAPLREPDRNQFERIWAAQLAAHLSRAETVRRVWPSHLPPPMIFKGADLAEHLFDDPGARQALDVDLLLPAPAFHAAHRALAAHADEVRRPRAERHPWESPHALGYVFDGSLIELHRDPVPPHRLRLDGVDLYARSRPGRLGEMAVRVPTPRDRVLLWLANLAKGAFFGDVADLLDGAILLRALGPDPTLGPALSRAGLGTAWAVARHRLAAVGFGPPPRTRAPSFAGCCARCPLRRARASSRRGHASSSSSGG